MSFAVLALAIDAVDYALDGADVEDPRFIEAVKFQKGPDGYRVVLWTEVRGRLLPRTAGVASAPSGAVPAPAAARGADGATDRAEGPA